MMIVPRKNTFDIWDEMFKVPFFNRIDNNIMKTDIKDNKDNYSIVVDLPGCEKENIKIDVEDGYLTINASINSEINEEDEENFVRRERHFGECSRSFFVGYDITNEDIKASFKNGILKLVVPKKEATKKLPDKKYVEIDD